MAAQRQSHTDGGGSQSSVGAEPRQRKGRQRDRLPGKQPGADDLWRLSQGGVFHRLWRDRSRLQNGDRPENEMLRDVLVPRRRPRHAGFALCLLERPPRNILPSPRHRSCRPERPPEISRLIGHATGPLTAILSCTLEFQHAAFR